MMRGFQELGILVFWLLLVGGKGRRNCPMPYSFPSSCRISNLRWLTCGSLAWIVVISVHRRPSAAINLGRRWTPMNADNTIAGKLSGIGRNRLLHNFNYYRAVTARERSSNHSFPNTNTTNTTPGPGPGPVKMNVGQAIPPARSLASEVFIPISKTLHDIRQFCLPQILILSIFISLNLSAQPVLKTEMRNGIERAALVHAKTGTPVTDDSPALPGETLIVEGTGLTGNLAILLADSINTGMILDDQHLSFDLPGDVSGSFVEISLQSDDGRSNVSTTTVSGPVDPVQLSTVDVAGLLFTSSFLVDTPGLAVAIVDRAGNPLGIYRHPTATPDAVETALSLARTGAFFSHNEAPLSSRTVRFISTEHFPEGIPNQPAAALFGIENTNRGCTLSSDYLPNKAISPARNYDGTGPGKGISTFAGGIPLYRDGLTLIGGIGAAGVPPDTAEFVVVAATFGTPFFRQLPLPAPGAVYIDGFRLPFVNQTTRPTGTSPLNLFATVIRGGMLQSPPPRLAGRAAPEGWLVGPKPSSTLTADEVRTIIDHAVARANVTRAQIRLPLGRRTKMVISVSDLDGNILGLFRMPDATVFSIDVAATKARNVVYFSSPSLNVLDLPGVAAGTAVTNRTIGFGSQSFFPSGISNAPPGPFRDLYLYDSANPCTQGRQPRNANQSGVVFFPGSAPLYKNGKLVGGLGVSGDGVEQDDYVTAGGAVGFEAPEALRADQVLIRQVRLPYWKFPRNPEQ